MKKNESTTKNSKMRNRMMMNAENEMKYAEIK